MIQARQKVGKSILTERADLPRKLPSSFRQLLDHFSQASVKLVIRLNNPLYDSKEWLERGVDHKDLYFDDGTNPSDEIVKSFIHMCDHVISKGGRSYELLRTIIYKTKALLLFTVKLV